MQVPGGRERAPQLLAFSCGYTTANWLLHVEEAGQSLYLVHFPALNTLFSGKTLPGQMQLQFVCCSYAEMKGRQNRALSLLQKDSETHTTDIRREMYVDRHPFIVKSSHMGYTIIRFSVCGVSPVFLMSACTNDVVDACSVYL